MSEIKSELRRIHVISLLYYCPISARPLKPSMAAAAVVAAEAEVETAADAATTIATSAN